jgi:hypothetical protein
MHEKYKVCVGGGARGGTKEREKIDLVTNSNGMKKRGGSFKLYLS